MIAVPGRQFAFVVRVRLEEDTTAQHSQPILRGMIQPIGSDVVRYFGSLEDIPRIVAELTATDRKDTR